MKNVFSAGAILQAGATGFFINSLWCLKEKVMLLRGWIWRGLFALCGKRYDESRSTISVQLNCSPDLLGKYVDELQSH